MSTPYVVRPRLLDRLDAASRTSYTQVRAPAGWGKTVLLSGWVRNLAAPGAVIWLSTERTGVAAFDEVLTSSLADAFDVDADQVDAVVLAGGGGDHTTVVVVDGFDEVDDPAALARIESWVTCAQTRVRIVVACRTDPALPLHRWRVAGTMAELGPADLSFTIPETAELLGAHQVALADSELVELHALTEGWPAGLRLAALSLREQREQLEPTIADLLTRDRGITEYLAKELLGSLPPDRRQLLAETSVADRISAGLVEALTGRSDGGAALAELEYANAFVRQSGRPMQWYRHHPLLSSVLYEELRREAPGRLRELHGRAAAWHADNGLPAAAIRHALAAADWSRATSVLDAAWPDVVMANRRGGAHIPVPAKPDQAGRDPWLSPAFAAERLDSGDLAGLRTFLRMADEAQPAAAEDRGAAAAAAGGVPPDMLTAFRIAEARLEGDHERVRRLAKNLLAHPRDARPGGAPDPVRVVGMVTLGTARLHLGEAAAAEPLLREGLRLAVLAGLDHVQVAALSQLGVLYASRGHLRDAMATGRRALALAHRLGLTHSADMAWARMAMAEAYLQWNRLDEGFCAVEEALDQAGGDPEILTASRILQARLWAAAGSVPAAFDAISAARRDAAGGQVAAPLRAAQVLVEAELRAHGGDPNAAQRLLSDLGDGACAAWVAVVRAEILLAEGKPAAAAAAVAPHVDDSVDTWSLTRTVQAAILSALAGCAMGDRDRASQGLRVALRIAEVHGHRSPFVTAHAQLRELLDSYAPALDVKTDVLADLAAAMDRHPGQQSYASTRGSPVQPLTERERIVLRYLRGTMSNVEIAATLYVSVNTVKTHLKSIYRKLGASRRREAVSRARDLRLL